MSRLEAIVLGILQGATEFLPISSSGHLVLVQHLLGMPEAQVLFDVLLHVGTLGAVILGYRKELLAMCRSVWAALLRRREADAGSLGDDPELRLILLIVIGSIPTAIIGLAFQDLLEGLFAAPRAVGAMLITTGILLLLPRLRRTPATGELTFAKALLIGCVQGLAITPGISRSGSTISIALLAGVRSEIAARYSFLLSIPAIAGAAILKIREVGTTSLSWPTMALGLASAFVVGYLCLLLLLAMLKRGRLDLFAWYCFAAGGLTLWLL